MAKPLGEGLGRAMLKAVPETAKRPGGPSPSPRWNLVPVDAVVERAKNAAAPHSRSHATVPLSVLPP